MLKELLETIPAGVVVAFAGWAGLSYLLGGEIGSRILLVDHAPICEANFGNWIAEAAEKKVAAIRTPQIDPSADIAAARLKQITNSPMFESLRESGLDALIGIGAQTDLVLDIHAAAKEQAASAYRRAIEAIEAETVIQVGKSGRVCECIASDLLGKTRTEWAVFTGTVGVVRPSRISDAALKARMGEIGICAGGAS